MYRVREATVKYKYRQSPVATINSPRDVYSFFKKKLRGETRENFYVLFLDIKNQVLAYELVAVGKSDGAVVDIKEILRSALLIGADQIILVHNHPSGIPKPSGQDIAFSAQVKDACKLLDIEMLDHVIIGEQKFASCREGWEVKEE